MRLGLTLLFIGTVVIGGYGAYTMIRFVILDPEAPVAIRVGLPTVMVGALVLLIKVLWDRLRTRATAAEKRIEEAQP